MPYVSFRFYAELNDHLHGTQRQVTLIYAVKDGATVGDAVESLGVPKNEVDLVLVNGESHGLTRELHNGDYFAFLVDEPDYSPSGGREGQCREQQYDRS